MKYVQIWPAKDWHTNDKALGKPYGMPDLPLTCWKNEAGTEVKTSTYKLSFWQRVFLFFTGRLHVSLFCERHPPIAVGIGGLFTRNHK